MFLMSFIVFISKLSVKYNFITFDLQYDFTVTEVHFRIIMITYRYMGATTGLASFAMQTCTLTTVRIPTQSKSDNLEYYTIDHQFPIRFWMS